MNDAKNKNHMKSINKNIDPGSLKKAAEYIGNKKDDSFSLPDPIINAAPSGKNKKIIEKGLKEEKELELSGKQNDLQIQINTEYEVMLFSSKKIWLNIMRSSLLQHGFIRFQLFDQAELFFREILQGIASQNNEKVLLCIAENEITSFIIAWENLRRGHWNDKIGHYLDAIPFIFLIDHIKNVHESVTAAYGEHRFITVHSLQEKNSMHIYKLFKLLEQNKEKIIEAG